LTGIKAGPRRAAIIAQELRRRGCDAADRSSLLGYYRPSLRRTDPMSETDLLVVVAAGLSTLVIWLGVVIQGRIAAALASRH